jgi:hypothetical protein
MIASMTICNTLAIIILDIEFGIDDYIIFKYSNDKRKRKAKIKYDYNRQSYYFTSHGYRYYLDEFIREGI